MASMAARSMVASQPRPAGVGAALCRSAAALASACRSCSSDACMAVATFFSRLTGFGRVVALAYAFGFTRLTDSYNLANTTPNIIYDLVLGGIMAAFIIKLRVQLLRDPGVL